MRKTLLLGAGFSYDLGMPLTSELTSVFLDTFNKKNAKHFANALSANDPFSAGRPINRTAIHEGMALLLDYKGRGGKNYEEILAMLESLDNLPKKSQSDRDSYHYLFGVLHEILAEVLIAYQFESFDVLYAAALPAFSNLKNLLNDQETWIFSLNHDLYVECLAIDLGIPITYGDTNDLIFPANNIDPETKIRFTTSDRSNLNRSAPGWIKGTRGINLVRIHGGIAELLYGDQSIICNPSLQKAHAFDLINDLKAIESMGYIHNGQRVPSMKDRVVAGPDGTLDILCRAMLTGGRKYSRTTNPKRGEEKLALFDQVLRETDELTMIGYSFGDPHVNYRVSNAMVLNSDMRIQIVDPAHRPKPEFLEQFDYGLRIRGAQCRTPEWMSYVFHKKWDSALSGALKESEKHRDEIIRRVRRRLPW